MPVEWAPTVDDVGALLRARTTDDSDDELGTFSSVTRPTDTQVEALILTAAGHVASRVGSSSNLCEEGLTEQATGLAALYAAMLVELSYFPEQVGGNKSPYDKYKELFDDGIESLTDAVARICGGGEGEGDTDVVGSPTGDFGPYDSVGRDTQW